MQLDPVDHSDHYNFEDLTRAQLSQRKPTVAFLCYWQTDVIHTFRDLGYLKLTASNFRTVKDKLPIYCYH